MKFGFRTPSLRKRIAARTSPARFIRHSLGLKAPRGWGWITNPKKAAYNRVYNRTTFGCLLPILGVLLLVALLGGWAFAQTASFYGPSGGYMGYAVVTPAMPPGAIPEATAAGMPTGNVKCGDELPKDQYRKFLPAGMEPAPGLGICEEMRRMGK